MVGILADRKVVIQLQQLNNWIRGKNLHINEKGICDKDDDGAVCVPDFSCCCEGVETPVETKMEFKEAYMKNDQDKIHCMLMGFLKTIPSAEVIDIKDYINKDKMKVS